METLITVGFGVFLLRKIYSNVKASKDRHRNFDTHVRDDANRYNEIRQFDVDYTKKDTKNLVLGDREYFEGPDKERTHPFFDVMNHYNQATNPNIVPKNYSHI